MPTEHLVRSCLKEPHLIGERWLRGIPMRAPRISAPSCLLGQARRRLLPVRRSVVVRSTCGCGKGRLAESGP